ncbi:hypothetical protein ACWA7J_05995 [Leptothrix sp. BB-4]
MLTLQDLLPGDVLLCRYAITASPRKVVRAGIEAVTGSPYTHAAIVLTSSLALDARPGHGVESRPLAEVVGEALYVAVLRHPDAWNESRLESLIDYAAALQAMGVGYNYREALRYSSNKRAHDVGTMDALTEYFDEGKPEPATDFGPFFCSELVAACFVHSGFIHTSAAIVIAPGVQAPGDLAMEPAFGYLVGFVASDPSVEVLHDDPLMTHARYADIFGQ